MKSACVHGRNISSKECMRLPMNQRTLIASIKPRYESWRSKSLAVDKLSRANIQTLTRALNSYKSFIESPEYTTATVNGRKQMGFSPQSKLHSSVLEEFIYYVIRLLPSTKRMSLGPTEAFAHLYFAPRDIRSFEKSSGMSVHTKNQDFAVFKTVRLSSSTSGCDRQPQEIEVQIPVLSVECKTYVDKTMLEASIATADRIKRGNPYCKYFVVTEAWAVGKEVDPRHSSIDQIYLFRKDRGRRATSAPKLIDDKVVYRFATDAQSHLDAMWSDMGKKIRSGVLI